MIKVWSLDNEKAVLIVNGEMVKGEVEYLRGQPFIKAEDGQTYNPNKL